MKGVSSIHVTEEVSLITFNGLPSGTTVLAEIFSDFAKANIDIDMISQTAPIGGQLSISFTVAGADFVQVLEIASSYKERHPSMKPLVSPGNCKIQLFGQEMRGTPGVAAAAISSVASAGCELVLITTSEVDISFLVAASTLESALSALEADFGLTAER